jgi:hypothetical protein
MSIGNGRQCTGIDQVDQAGRIEDRLAGAEGAQLLPHHRAALVEDVRGKVRGVDGGICRLRGVHEHDLVVPAAEGREDVLQHAERLDRRQLDAELLAELTPHGLGGRLAELDAAAQRAVERLPLRLVPALEHQDVVAAPEDGQRHRADRRAPVHGITLDARPDAA